MTGVIKNKCATLNAEKRHSMRAAPPCAMHARLRLRALHLERQGAIAVGAIGRGIGAGGGVVATR